MKTNFEKDLSCLDGTSAGNEFNGQIFFHMTWYSFITHRLIALNIDGKESFVADKPG